MIKENINPNLPKKLSSSKSDLKDYVRFMLQYLKSYKATLWLLTLAILFFIIAGRLIPLIFGWAVDYGIKGQNKHFIYLCGFALVFSNALRAILSFIISYQFRLMGQKILYQVRADLLEHVQKIKITFFDKNPSGKIVTRIANDTKSLGDLFSDGLSGIFINIIEIASILISLFFISWPMALIVILVLPPVLWATGFLSEKIRQQFILIKSKLSSINAFSAENLNGIEVLQLYSGEELVTKNFNQNVDEYKNLQLKSITYFALLWPIVEFFQVFSILLSLVVGFYLLNSNMITIGQIGAFILMLQGFFRPLRFILEKYNQVQNGITSSQRIIRLFAEKTENYDKPQNAIELQDNKNPLIEVKNLNFSYTENNPILKNINFSIQQGTKTAIIGKTGSGKTTLVSLLQGFYNCPKNSIWLYNQAIEDITVNDLRKKLLVVRQDEFIFKGNVQNNISIGSAESNISEDRIKNILSEVGLNFSLNDQIDEMGANLSAGEKQLIALARVMIYDPEIIILDEATSHIDSISEQKVLKAFDKILEGRTSIVIAHRLTTVLKCDQILILDNGILVETGHPKDLIKNPKSIFNTFYDELL
jgi:ATP-binding cassette, subfamily B, multidrug efflux pump